MDAITFSDHKSLGNKGRPASLLLITPLARRSNIFGCDNNCHNFVLPEPCLNFSPIAINTPAKPKKPSIPSDKASLKPFSTLSSKDISFESRSEGKNSKPSSSSILLATAPVRKGSCAIACSSLRPFLKAMSPLSLQVAKIAIALKSNPASSQNL